MIEIMQTLLPYISGLWTLPWILVGFFVTWLLQNIFAVDKIDKVMKKIGIITLYFFVPLLVFRSFFDNPMGRSVAVFLGVTCLTITGLYSIAYLFAKYQIRKTNMDQSQATIYLKTMLTNQGRSSAFVGGALLAIPGWGIEAGIYIAVTGVALFAVMPYLLYHMNQKEQKGSVEPVKLPWFLRVYPGYFIAFVLAAIVLHQVTGMVTKDLGSWGIVLRFYTSLTVPIALYYVGSGMHPRDLKLSELRKLTGAVKDDNAEHWQWVRQTVFLTSLLTPALFLAIFGGLYAFKVIPSAWFAVLLINSTLPITSTNLFLVPYGIDKRATAHAVTWTTLIGVPIAVFLIWLLSVYLP